MFTAAFPAGPPPQRLSWSRSFAATYHRRLSALPRVLPSASSSSVVGFYSAGQEVVAECDGAAHARFGYIKQIAFPAAVFQQLDSQGESSAVPVHLNGGSGESGAVVILLLSQFVEPFLEDG